MIDRAHPVISAVAAAFLVTGAAIHGAAAADRAFGGEDAAYIDWAFKNCQIASTDKERGLASQASAKSGDVFAKAYEAQYRKLADGAGAATARQATCESIVGWYGPLGSRITELVIQKVEKPADTGASAGSNRPPDRPAPARGSAQRGS